MLSRHPAHPSAALAAIVPLLAIALALPAAADPETQTIAIDCAQGQSIQQALAHPADQLIVEISGMCQERVVITRSNVTLIGTDPTNDGITGPAVADPVVQRALVRVLESRNVRFENLSVTGSEMHGIEGGELAFMDIVNCRITANAGRGLQIATNAFARVEDTFLGDNGSIDLITFNGGLVNCTRCTISRGAGVPVVAANDSRISLTDSSVTTSGFAAVAAQSNAFVYGDGSDASSSFWAIWALEGSQISWNGGDLDGSAVADTASQLFLNGVNQTSNVSGNLVTDDSHLRIVGGTFIGVTRLTGFSDGTAEGAPSFDSVTCDRGGDLFCDGSETKTGSSCGLCP